MKNLSLIKKENLQDFKDDYFKNKDEIELNFYKHNNGLKTCYELSKLTDTFIKNVYNKLLIKNQLLENDIVITALGGYGRKHLAPFSDLDIMFVPFSKKRKIKKTLEEILYFLWDNGFKVGHSVRYLAELKELAKKDLLIKTSLIDMRKICGSDLNTNLIKKLVVDLLDDCDLKEFYDFKINERQKLIRQDIYSPYFLEPNIKEGYGGLRDLNILFWFLERFFGTKNLNLLVKQNKISNSEKIKIFKSLNFLITVRCYLHFINKRDSEKLTFDLQKIISGKMKYRECKPNLRVERFMKHFYLHASNIHFLTKHLPKSLLNPVGNKISTNEKSQNGINISGDFLTISDNKIFLQNSENLINIFFESINLKIPIHSSVFRFLFDKISSFEQIFFKDYKIRLRFEEILLNNVFEDTINSMNDCGVLSKLIPHFAKINFKPQFDLHHSYTVDQHTIKAINLLRKLNSKGTEIKFFDYPNYVFKKIKQKRRLFLAVLFHDIGKGYGKPHHSKGADIARGVLTKLNYPTNDINEICWLVKNHLIFSDFAFKKDLEERSEIKSFVEMIESEERLKLLYLLTVVDLASVNKKSWNSWRSSLLERLYKKCFEEISKPLLMKFQVFDEKTKKTISKIQKKVFFGLEKNTEKNFSNFCKITIPEYWTSQSIKDISKQIDLFFCGDKLLKPNNFLINTSKIKGILEVTIVSKDRERLLLDIIQIFLYFEMEVLEARIFTFKNNLIIDTFKISPSSKLNFNENDLQQKKNKLLNYFNKKFEISTKLKEHNKIRESFNKSIKVIKSVEIDYSSSDTFCIIKVVSNNRKYLLYDILKLMLKKRLNISVAKISTNLDFIEDSFYVKKKEIKNILSEKGFARLKENLLKII